MTQLYTNPEYLVNQEDWIQSRDLFEGKHKVLSGSKYLWANQIEKKPNDPTSAALRVSREQRTRYLNITEIIVSLWQSLFFKEEIKVTGEFRKLLDEHKSYGNIDGKKSSFNSFARNRVLPSILNYGAVYVIADSYPIAAKNRAEEKAKGLRPYLDVIEPLSATDWCYQYDKPEAGDYQFFRHEFNGILPRAKPSEEPKLRKYSYSLILDGNSYIVEPHYVDLDSNFAVIKDHWDVKTNSEDWQPGQQYVVSLPRIPVAHHISESWLKDVNEESLRYHNIRSNKDNILHQQGYTTRAVTGIGPKDSDAIKALSEYTILILPENGTITQLPPGDVSGYERAEAQALSNAFKMGLNKLRELPSDSKETQSSDAQDGENQFTFALVESELEAIENLLKESARNYGMLSGKNDLDPEIEVNKEISNEDFNDFKNTWFAFKDLLAVNPEISAEVAKKAIKKLNLSEEVTQKLDKLLNNADVLTQEKDPIDAVING